MGSTVEKTASSTSDSSVATGLHVVYWLDVESGAPVGRGALKTNRRLWDGKDSPVYTRECAALL